MHQLKLPAFSAYSLMVRDAYRFLIPLLVLGATLAFLHLNGAALLVLILGAFVGFFFRNPDRVIPFGDHIVVSPADGKIVRISERSGANEESGGHDISIFLSVFNVHVNRAPIGGNLEKVEYKRGRFKAAFDDEASRVNEQNVLTIRAHGSEVTVRQIAGLIARRVVCWKKPGNELTRGELIGLIRFGSRVDLVVPRQVKLMVKVGDRVKGGSSIIGEFE